MMLAFLVLLYIIPLTAYWVVDSLVVIPFDIAKTEVSPVSSRCSAAEDARSIDLPHMDLHFYCGAPLKYEVAISMAGSDAQREKHSLMRNNH